MLERLPHPIECNVQFTSEPSIRTYLRFNDKISFFNESYYGKGEEDSYTEVKQAGKSVGWWDGPLEDNMLEVHNLLEKLLKEDIL